MSYLAIFCPELWPNLFCIRSFFSLQTTDFKKFHDLEESALQKLRERICSHFPTNTYHITSNRDPGAYIVLTRRVVRHTVFAFQCEPSTEAGIFEME